MNKKIILIVLFAAIGVCVWSAIGAGRAGGGAKQKSSVSPDEKNRPAPNENNGSIDLVRPPFLDK